MVISSDSVKKTAASLGATLCGIASVERFFNAPGGYQPQDVLPGCRSVIVIALGSLNSTFLARALIPYTIMRNDRYTRLSEIEVQLAAGLESEGETAIPIPPGEPCAVDFRARKLRGIISLKHAAVHAGLGILGKKYPAHQRPLWQYALARGCPDFSRIVSRSTSHVRGVPGQLQVMHRVVPGKSAGWSFNKPAQMRVLRIRGRERVVRPLWRMAYQMQRVPERLSPWYRYKKIREQRIAKKVSGAGTRKRRKKARLSEHPG